MTIHLGEFADWAAELGDGTLESAAECGADAGTRTAGKIALLCREAKAAGVSVDLALAGLWRTLASPRK